MLHINIYIYISCLKNNTRVGIKVLLLVRKNVFKNINRTAKPIVSWLIFGIWNYVQVGARPKERSISMASCWPIPVLAIFAFVITLKSCAKKIVQPSKWAVSELATRTTARAAAGSFAVSYSNEIWFVFRLVCKFPAADRSCWLRKLLTFYHGVTVLESLRPLGFLRENWFIKKKNLKPYDPCISVRRVFDQI